MRMIGLVLTLILFGPSAGTPVPAPPGWRLTTPPEEGAFAFLDSTIVHGGRWSFLLARTDGDEGVVSLSQSFRPESIRGKRIQLTAWARSQEIDGYGFFWLRVDGKEIEDILAFDNMSVRTLRGTNEWRAYRIVVDVPTEAASVVFGAYLSGIGQLWVDDFSFETVSTSTAVTDLMVTERMDPVDRTVTISDSVRIARNRRIADSPASPRNLGFEE